MCNPATSYAVESTSARNPRNNKPNARRSSMNKQTFMTKTTNDEKGNKSDPRGQNNQTEKNISERSQRTQETTDRSTKRPCFLCNNKDHHIDKCPQFLGKTLEDRKQYAKSQNLCFACLNPKHLAKNCKYKKRCRICGRRHPTSLHDDSMPSKNSDTAKAATREEPVSVSSSLVISHLSVSKEACKSAMTAPVFVSHTDRPGHLLYALLNTQSDASFITATTSRTLGIDGPAIDLCLSTCPMKNRSPSTRR